MTKTEIILQDKVNKEDCETKHKDFKTYLDEKMDSLEKLFVEKLKGVAWFNWIHLIGYVSIITTLIAIFVKLK